MRNISVRDQTAHLGFAVIAGSWRRRGHCAMVKADQPWCSPVGATHANDLDSRVIYGAEPSRCVYQPFPVQPAMAYVLSDHAVRGCSGAYAPFGIAVFY